MNKSKRLIIFTTEADHSIIHTVSNSNYPITLYYYSQISISNEGILIDGKLFNPTDNKVLLLRDGNNVPDKDYTAILYYILHTYHEEFEIFESDFLLNFPQYHDKLYQIPIITRNFKIIKIPSFQYPVPMTEDLPQMAKMRVACRNRGNFLVTNKQTLQKYTSDQNFFLQELIDFEDDIRLTFLNGEFMSAIGRTRNEKGKLRMSKDLTDTIPKKIKAEIFIMIQRMKLNFVGVDLLRKGGEYYFLEINRSPQYLGTERISEKNIGKLLIECLLNE